jgi:predicted DNA-binding WGR domain protein
MAVSVSGGPPRGGPNRPVHLRRIDATVNMSRFYVPSVPPTLFGGTSLIRTWGRIGTVGGEKIEIYDDTATASAEFGRLEQSKRRRTYSSVPVRDMASQWCAPADEIAVA